jgi:plastocyanin
MKRGLSIALAMAAALNLWALPAGPLAQQPGPEGGRVTATTATGDIPQPVEAASPRAHHVKVQHVKAAAASGVTIRDFSFGPSSVSVNVGDAVTWSNQGKAAHTATANNGSFDTGTLNKGQSGSHTFTTAGTFSYHCTIHPFMKGTVFVAAASGGGSDRATGTGSGGSAGSGGGSAGTTGSTTTPAAPAQSSSGLPNSGVDVGWLLLSGALLTASGLALRRTARG